MLELNGRNFNQIILGAKLPILVDFWAPWCAPCKALLPLLEQLDKELKTTLLVAKLNAQEHMNTAQEYKITNLPTLLLFKNGIVVHRHAGNVTSIQALRKIIDPYLG